MYTWTTSVRLIKGLGPVKAKELNGIGIETVGDLLCYKPLHYIYQSTIAVLDTKVEFVAVKAKIIDIKRTYTQTVVATLEDSVGTRFKAQWYHSPWSLQSIRPGMVVTFWGKLKAGVLQQPKWTTVESVLADVYGGQYGVHHATIRVALKEVLANADVGFTEHNNSYVSRAYVFEVFHFPTSKEAQQEALNILKFDECLQLQLALSERKQKQKQEQAVAGTYIRLDNVGQYFPYEFTEDQEKAIEDICDDLYSGKQMQRLIHGEVGAGKSAVMFYAAIGLAQHNKRTLILAPTTILAQQHYDTLRSMGWNGVDLVTGSTPEQIDSQTANYIVVGTHAMLNCESLLKSASLVIIDEFQKFGVEQRAKIQKHNPHLLLISATPIPRTLSASVFGGLSVSIIRQLPIERGTVVTRWVLPDKREQMYEIIERELAKGHQAYFVYPRIDGDEDVASARRDFNEIAERFNVRVCLLTGRASREDKATALQNFREGITKILISTIIAEVGLDNPNATVMVIEGADRFGLSQLHQLRGRICRSTDTAFCFLVSETANQTSIDRLEVIEKCNDGFEIAEHDLRLRGPGELFSTKQHGLPDLKFISLVDDYDMMVEARELVQSGGVSSGVRNMMKIRYNLQLGDII